MLKAAARNDWLDEQPAINQLMSLSCYEQPAMMECLTSIRRADADGIIKYFARLQNVRADSSAHFLSRQLG
jgi:delta-aminolevulinic acid dehydratase/porphobilinogen synthase